MMFFNTVLNSSFITLIRRLPALCCLFLLLVVIPAVSLAASPITPSNTTPANGATGVSRTPSLAASAYSDGDGDPHKASQWQLSTNTGANFTANIIYDSGPCTNLTSHAISSTLAVNTTYYWHVRYQDDQNNWSAYSATTSFITVSLIPSGAIAHWKFEEASGTTAIDSIGNNNSTLVNGATRTSAGKSGKALSLDGINDHVDIPKFSFATNVTLEAWFNGNDVGGYNRILSFRRLTGFGNELVLSVSSNAVQWVGWNSGGGVAWEISFSAVQNNRWYHVAATANATTAKLYIDGQVVATSGVTGSFDLANNSSTSWYIGRDHYDPSNNRWFKGLIDEVIVYNTALTGAEVLARYNAANLATSPARPVNNTPANGATGITINTNLTGGAFSDPDGNNHQASHWQIRTADGAYGDAASYDSGVTGGLTTHAPVSFVMTENSHYFWHVQYKDSTGLWSSWSAETDFTIRSNTVPNTPTAVSPSTVTIAVRQPTFTSSAFSDPDAGDTHRASQWRVSTVSGNYTGANLVHDSGTTNSGLIAYDMPANLTVSTTYYWQVRHQDNGEKWSAWSAEASFDSAANLLPLQPVNSSPAHGATVTDRTPTLAASAFDDEPENFHLASQWQISTASGLGFNAGCIYDSGPVTDLTSHILQASLARSTTYYWRVRYQDGGGLWSEYSTETSFTTTSYESLTGAVAHWRMDTGSGVIAPDSIGGNDGTLVGNTSWTTGVADGGLAFDGSGDYVQISHDAALNPTTALTLECWVKSNTATWNNDGFLMSKRDAYIFHPSSGSKNVTFYIYSGGNWRSVTASLSIDLTQWHHYVGTFNGSALKIYVDGALKSTTSYSGTINADTGPLFLGRDDGLERYLNGRMDEVVIYNRALSDAEILTRFNDAIKHAPNRPSCSSPSNGATNQSPVPTLTGTAFSDADGHTHTASRWQARQTGTPYGSLTSYDSGVITTGTLTEHKVPDPLALLPGGTYYWHLQYRDSSNDWSAWSEEKSFTVRDNTAPNTPTAISPINGVTVTTAKATLTAAAFSDPNGSGDAYASRWRVSRVSGDYSAQHLFYDSGEITLSLTSHVLPKNLVAATTYYWQVRHRDLGGAWSAWSAEASFVTETNFEPEQPANVTPANNATNISQFPVLTGSAFVDADAGETHQMSQWQVSTATGGSFNSNMVYDSGQGTDLLTHTLTTSLVGSTNYYWRVRYQDGAGNWSPYSAETMFTTAAPLSVSIKLHWKFDETSGTTAYDAVAHHNGALTQGSWTTDGKHNGALRFDGYDDRVSTSFSAWQPDSYSVEFWIYPGACANNSYPRFSSIDNMTNTAFYFSYSSCNVVVGSDDEQTFTVSEGMTLNVWQHFVFTYTDSTNTGILYKNGVVVGSSTAMTTHRNWVSFHVGRQYDSINGIVDEVVVYERALDPSEVLARYQAGGAMPKTPPNKPSNSSPSNGATNQVINPALTSSAFSDPDAGDTHAASRWRLRKDGSAYGDADSHDSGITGSSLTSYTIEPGPAWVAAGYAYRRKITLAPVIATVNYLVRVDLNAQSFEYGNTRADGYDIRFYSGDGTELSYYREVWDANGDSTFQVKVTTANTDTIYMYYGNVGAADGSTTTIFTFFDNFSTNTHNNYTWSGGGSSSWNATDKWLTVNTADNVNRTMKRNVSMAASGYARVIMIKRYDWYAGSNQNDQHFKMVQDANNYYNFVATGGGYSFQGVYKRIAGVQINASSETGTVSALHHESVIEMWWTPSVMRMDIDGVTRKNISTDTTSLTPTYLEFTHNQINVDIRSILIAESSAAVKAIATVGNETTQTTVLLDYGTRYYFQVQYVDNTGAWSQFSDETLFTTINDVVAAAPTDLSAVANGSCQVDLSWTDASSNETYFYIERCAGAGCINFAEIATVAPGVESYSDTTGLSANESHSYRVYAVNSGGFSDAAGPATASTTSITYYQDSDGDLYGNNGVTQEACSQPAGYVSDNADCDDTSAEVNPITAWYLDADGDGYSEGTSEIQCADPGDTYYLPSELFATSGDCDDGNSTVNPATVWYQDADGDLYSAGVTATQCTDPGADYYSAAELTATSGDCNDSVAAIKPGAAEVCDGVDNDCDGSTDEGFAQSYTYYRDADNDGYGSLSNSLASCLASAPTGYVTNSSDCNDGSAAIKPEATEYCNGIDDDCDGTVDDSCVACDDITLSDNAPSTFTATVLNAFKIQLVWNDRSDCEDGFEIEVQLWNGEWVLKKTVEPAVTTYTDTEGIDPGKQYTYRVRAYQGVNKSIYKTSNTVTAPAYSSGDTTCD